MLSAINLSGNALLAQTERQDAAADNLANVSTAGYKRVCIGVRSGPSAFAQLFGDALAADAQVLSVTSHFDDSPGELNPTGNPCDLALRGRGYFTLLDGATRVYTRNGSFHLDGASTLVDAQGRPVLGQRGPIRLTGASWSVTEDGGVLVDGAEVDRLALVDFPATAAVRRGDCTLTTSAAILQPVTTPVVKQGFLEASNVRPIEEMIQMLSDMRAFESNQRLITAYDQLLGMAVSEVGRT